MERLFVDTSAWFAYVNRKDPDHRRVGSVLNDFEGRLVTSSFIFDEVVTLVRARLGHDTACRVGKVLLNSVGVDLVRVTPDDERAAWLLFCRRADKNYSFTDCTSFALLRRLEISTVASLDEDFRQEGFESVPDQTTLA